MYPLVLSLLHKIPGTLRKVFKPLCKRRRSFWHINEVFREVWIHTDASGHGFVQKCISFFNTYFFPNVTLSNLQILDYLQFVGTDLPQLRLSFC
jgi:hypothetical protein